VRANTQIFTMIGAGAKSFGEIYRCWAAGSCSAEDRACWSTRP